MVCYIIPTLAAAIHFMLRKRVYSWQKSVEHKWLTLLLLGGSTFGIIDHIWNREFFLLGEHILQDIMLGFTITIVLVTLWTSIVVFNTIKTPEKVVP